MDRPLGLADDYVTAKLNLQSTKTDGGRELISPLFLNDDTDAQELIIKHLLLPYAKGDFHPSYLHEHAGGRLSAFLKSDLFKIRPINSSSSWRRGAAHLINASVKEDASTFFTQEFPNFIQCAGSVDGASVCAKLVSMIHDQPLESEHPTIICQIDFANAFQTPNRQLGTNDCILGIASRTYDQGRVKIGDALPHLTALKNFFPYFKNMNDVASRNMLHRQRGDNALYPWLRGGMRRGVGAWGT